MNLLGEEMFFSVIDLDKSKALIGYSGETVEEAVDEFELKLQKTNGDTLTFYADKATPYPGSMILEVNLKTMTQKAIFNSEGDELKFSGECTKI